MDLGFNKIAFCVLGTALLAIGVNEISHGFFHEKHHDKMGYFVEVPETPAGGAAPVEEGPRDYGVLLASANIEAGKAAAVKCAQCHSFEPGGAVIQGPTLYNIMGRDIAGMPGFTYSSGPGGLASREGVWDYEHFDHFVEGPKRYAPGTTMNFVGLRRQQERADLMAYLRTLTSGAPYPIPDPLPAQPEVTLVEGEAPPADETAPAVADGGAIPPTEAPPPVPTDTPAPEPAQ